MATNMTSGAIVRPILIFTIPTILGNLFQLTYNAADSVIVGRFADKYALAAVGTASPVMNIVVFFIVGICMGASVLMSEFYGAQDIDRLKREVSTTVSVGFIFTAVISIICWLFARIILRLIQTPPEIIDNAALYLRVIFIGLIFTFIYNVCAAALRSIGDSKTPIIFLIFSSLLNIALDLYFVAVLRMGVFGAAFATVISQAVSCILCVVYVYKKVPLLHLPMKELMIVDRSLLGKTISYSWATAMQQTCLYIGKVLVQSSVNMLGVNSIATFNAVTRVDDFALQPEQSISHSMTVFIAQNRGAKKSSRIGKGFLAGMLMEAAYWIILCPLVLFAAPSIMRLFVPDGDPNVVSLGVNYLQAMAFFYLLPGLTNGLQGFFRGMGRMQITLLVTFVQITVRVIFSYILAPTYGIFGVACACFIGWVAMFLGELPLCLSALRQIRSESID